jgi:hypothetical protein
MVGGTRTAGSFTRRNFLQLAGVASLIATTPMARWAFAAPAASGSKWSDPATWGGAVPAPGASVSVSKPIILDVDATVSGLTIEPGGTLAFDPGASRTLTSTGNVVVRGTLQMRPGSAPVIHRLSFPSVREAGFVGGGMDPLATDVGLWVMDAGLLDVAGTPKLAWARTTASVARGSRTITLDADPIGWSVGDEVTITPTASPASTSHATSYDTSVITAISGRQVTLATATAYEHPAVSVGRGIVMTPEVLNLTRNVRVEGTAAGRTHVFLRSTRPQVLSNAQIRHVGPRVLSGGVSVPVLGRYGLHFHMADEGSRGSLLDGIVLRDAGNHAFVTHMSHGVTLRNCISHDTYEDAYWWDLDHDTNDIVYDRCVASLVRAIAKTDGYYTLTGFGHNRGTGNIAMDCVAVGVQSTKNASGFNWPSQANGSDGVWTFTDCVAHNENANGIYTWQNTDNVHTVSGFVAYHNGGYGIRHGAYRNPYHYVDSVLYGNRSGGVLLSALSKAGQVMTFENVLIDQAGLAPYCITTNHHSLEAQAPGLITRCDFKGYTSAAVAFLAATPGSAPEVYDLVDCSYAGNEFWLDAKIPAASVVRVKDTAHGSIALRRSDQPGTLVSKWNARTSAVTF